MGLLAWMRSTTRVARFGRGCVAQMSVLSSCCLPLRHTLHHDRWNMTPLSQVYWYQQRARPRRELPPLAGNAEVGMVVVGGGVAGLTCAHALSERGHKVVVLERSFCGSGASGRSSGFITPDSEMELSDLVRSRGLERARRLWEFVVSGVDEIRGNIQGYRIDCDYQVQDSLFLANSPKGASKVIREHDARTRMGYESTLYDAH